MKTAAKSEDALRSKGAGAEFGKMFKGFELYSIYFTSAIGGAVAGWVYLGPHVGGLVGPHVGDLIGAFIGCVLGVVCGLSVLVRNRGR